MAYPISKWIIPFIYRPWIRKVEGLENVPEKGPFIIAANHSSYFDIFLPPVVIVPKVNANIGALVNNHYWKPFITRLFLNLWNAIPVYVDKDQNSRKKNKQAIENAMKCLRGNELVMIFPEGTRSRDGKLKKAYTGVARLALKSKAPVLPFAIIGSGRILPKGKLFPRLARCEVRIGKPIHFEKYYNKKTNEKTLETATRQIMKEIARLIGQKYSY